MIDLKCHKCKCDHKRPERFEKLADKPNPNKYYLTAMLFCNTCMEKQERAWIKKMGELKHWLQSINKDISNEVRQLT